MFTVDLLMTFFNSYVLAVDYCPLSILCIFLYIHYLSSLNHIYLLILLIKSAVI